MQGLALAAAMDHVGSDRYLLIIFSDRGQVEVVPAVLSQQPTCEVILVEALHDQNDGTSLLVIEAGHKRGRVPIVDRATRFLRLSVVSLHWIINNNRISAAAGEGAAHRHGEPPAAFGGD